MKLCDEPKCDGAKLCVYIKANKKFLKLNEFSISIEKY